MCGIIGIHSINGGVSPEWIKMMADILKHRGPDDEGFLAVDTKTWETHHLTGSDSKVTGQRIESFNKSAHLFLGHRRLSILDPTPSGHQPMSNINESLWITYNGEIYNYIELRSELSNLGYTFRTNTDTEVLLAAYEEWGEDCLQKINGMWAFVIYDRRKGILFGSRDRFGVKPFYYFFNSGIFAFASEIKALVKLPFIKKEINSRAVFKYLVLDWEEGEEEGFFKGIFELLPSYAFSYSLSEGKLIKRKYYSLQYNDQWEEFDAKKFKEHKDNVRNLIFQSVALRLRSDVPIGSCLSGGLDSSGIVCVTNKLLEKGRISQIGERQKVFTAGYEGEKVDESKWAKIVVEHTGALWYQVFPKSYDLLNELEDLIYTQDMPFGSTSIFAQYRVMKLAGESGIKVLLDGQGGDELFTGYAAYYRAFLAEVLKHFDFMRFINEWAGLNNSPVKKKALLVSYLGFLGARLMPALVRDPVLKISIKGNNYINNDFWQEYKESLEAMRDGYITSLNRMLFEYINGFKLKSLLRYEDRNSMRFSLESRTPFADDINLIEYIFQVPSVYKIHNGWSKYILRQAIQDILPEKIASRKDKIGFVTPEYHWLNEIKDYLSNYVTPEVSEFIDVKKLQKCWTSLFKTSTNGNMATVWRFINLAVWKKVYFK